MPPSIIPRWTVLFAVVFGLVTLAVPWMPIVSVQFAPGGRVAVAVAAAMVALVAAYLLGGRFRPGGHRLDSVLAFAFGLLAVGNLLLFVPLPWLGTAVSRGWAPLAVRLVGAGVLAAAALLYRSYRPRPDGSPWGTVAALAATVLGVLAVLGLLQQQLPAMLSPGGVAAPALQAHPLAQGGQVVIAVLYVAAAVGFYRSTRWCERELLAWLAAASALLAIAHAQQLVFFPWLYTEYLFTGDVARLAGYLLVLVGCVRELEGHWRQLADAAAATERRRVARDLHDGLAQELTFIAGEVRTLGHDPSLAERIAPLESSVDRAIDEARRAITVLAAREGSFEETLAETAETVTARSDARVVTEFVGGVDPPARVAQDLHRIVREAVRNAIRHGDADKVAVRAQQHARHLSVTISDDGVGFDPADIASRGALTYSGFGLISMRDRAEALGGALRIDSAPGRGTTVEVTIPWTNQSES